MVASNCLFSLASGTRTRRPSPHISTTQSAFSISTTETPLRSLPSCKAPKAPSTILSFLLCCGRTGPSKFYTRIYISVLKRKFIYFLIRVLLDDTDVTGTRGGRLHERYGISRSAGALVVVRPDGYVGTIAPLDELVVLDAYFAGFMLSP